MLASLRQPAKDPRVAIPVGGAGGEGGSVATTTREVKLTHPTRGAKDLPPAGSLKTQEDANNYFIKAVEHAMVTVAEEPPENPVVGELWWSTAGNELTLYVYVPATAAPLGGKTASGDWVPASPPVSLDGIEQHTMELEANVQALWKSSVPFDVFQPYAQKIDLLETELDKLEGVFIDVDLTYKFGYAPQRAPLPWLRLPAG